MRSPPLLKSFPYYQHTTVVCGGGGLNKYQRRPGDGLQPRLTPGVRAADLSREMINLRFVITGGPGTGKTTILHALAARGYICAAESARAIIRERLASGLSPRPPLAQFGDEILQRDIARYRETRA